MQPMTTMRNDVKFYPTFDKFYGGLNRFTSLRTESIHIELGFALLSKAECLVTIDAYHFEYPTMTENVALSTGDQLSLTFSYPAGCYDPWSEEAEPEGQYKVIFPMAISARKEVEGYFRKKMGKLALPSCKFL